MTVGTPDTNLKTSNSSGFVRAETLIGNPSTSADEADVRFTVNVTDVRRSSDLADYTGELEASLPLRITDNNNGPTLSDPATTSDMPLGVTVPCAATPSGGDIGATCSVVTTADAISPGTVLEGRRAVWALGQISVNDGGSDDVASTTPNTTFMRQGVFVP